MEIQKEKRLRELIHVSETHKKKFSSIWTWYLHREEEKTYAMTLESWSFSNESQAES